MATPLVQIAYLSAARVPFTQKALRELLAKARTNNHRLGATGVLLHADGSFLQVLEGPTATVDALYATIARDRRHDRLVRVYRTEIARPTFGDWSMGFAEADADIRARLLGFNDYLQSGSALGPSADKVRELAFQFRLGRWRQSVERSLRP
jgi:hypothetical protein